MAGTTMAAYKAALKAALVNALPSSVQVAYGDPGGAGQRERVWLGETQDGEQEHLHLRQGRRRRRERYILKVHVEVIGYRKDPEDNEAHAVELMTTVEETVADDPKLGVSSVLFGIVTGMAMATTETTDGPRTVITADITVEGDLL